MICEYCSNGLDDCKGEIKSRRALTAYHWNGKGIDPNRNLILCEDHYEMYAEYWEQRWDDLNNDIMQGIRDADYKRRDS